MMIELLFRRISSSTPRGTVIFIISACAHVLCYRVFVKEQHLNPRSEKGNLKGTFIKKKKQNEHRIRNRTFETLVFLEIYLNKLFLFYQDIEWFNTTVIKLVKLQKNTMKVNDVDLKLSFNHFSIKTKPLINEMETISNENSCRIMKRSMSYLIQLCLKLVSLHCLIKQLDGNKLIFSYSFIYLKSVFLCKDKVL